MGIASDIASLITKEATVTSNKVAKFAYTDTAYLMDNADGVTAYNKDADQNIPVGTPEVLTTNISVLEKGYRSQASSISRMLLNHFFGRVSYNLNKVNDIVALLLNYLSLSLGTANGIATLGANGKVPDAQLPPISSSIPDISQAEYDELTPEEQNNGQIRHITDAPETPVPFAVVNDSKTTSANVWTASKTKNEINTAKTQIMNRTSLDWSRAEETVATDLNENTFTATEDGVLFWDLTGGNNQFAYVQINNIFITKSIPTGNSYISSTNGSVMVSQGDIVKWKEGIVISSNVSLHKIIFVPYKAN